jgi:photosystem II stability/assembly factor-like uncharacterized protein
MSLRRILYIFILLLWGGAVSAADWHLIPLNTTDNFNGLHFTDENHGFIASTNGAIYELNLTNRGWLYKKNHVEKPLKGLAFQKNEKDGIAYGIQGIYYRTNDSGVTWILDSLKKTYAFSGLIFLDDGTGIMVGIDYTQGAGTPGVALKTTDNGLKWQVLDLKGIRFFDIMKSPDGPLVLTSLEDIFLSNDEGASWQAAKVAARGYVQAADVYGDKGIMVGKKGYLALSDDGGKNWEALPILDQMSSFNDVLMLDSKRAFIIGTAGEILYTDDSGHNWIPEASEAIEDLMDIQRIGNKIFVCGKGGTLVYTEIED